MLQCRFFPAVKTPLYGRLQRFPLQSAIRNCNSLHFSPHFFLCLPSVFPSSFGYKKAHRFLPVCFVFSKLTSFLPDRQRQPQKKNRFLGSFFVASVNKKDILPLFCTDSNYSPLPLTGLAAAPQSSARAAFATAHLTERHFSPIVRGSQRKKRGENLSFPLAAPDRLELTTLRLTAECSTD